MYSNQHTKGIHPVLDAVGGGGIWQSKWKSMIPEFLGMSEPPPARLSDRQTSNDWAKRHLELVGDDY